MLCIWLAIEALVVISIIEFHCYLFYCTWTSVYFSIWPMATKIYRIIPKLYQIPIELFLLFYALCYVMHIAYTIHKSQSMEFIRSFNKFEHMDTIALQNKYLIHKSVLVFFSIQNIRFSFRWNCIWPFFCYLACMCE